MFFHLRWKLQTFARERLAVDFLVRRSRVVVRGSGAPFTPVVIPLSLFCQRWPAMHMCSVKYRGHTLPNFMFRQRSSQIGVVLSRDRLVVPLSTRLLIDFDIQLDHRRFIDIDAYQERGIRIFLSICSLLKYNNIELSEGCCPPAHRTPSTMSPFPQLPPNPHRHHPSPPKVVSSVVVDELSTNAHEQRQCQDLLLMQSVLPTFYSTEV